MKGVLFIFHFPLLISYPCHLRKVAASLRFGHYGFGIFGAGFRASHKPQNARDC